MEEKEGFIYLVKAWNCYDSHQNPYKIGRAKNPDGRMYDLVTSCPFEISLLKTVWVENMIEAERFLHNYFEDRCIKGEWFRLKDSQVNWFIKLTTEKLKRLVYADVVSKDVKKGKVITIDPYCVRTVFSQYSSIKTCSKCKVEKKRAEDFYKSSSWCKECCRKSSLNRMK